MPELYPPAEAPGPLESAHAQQLEQGFPWLRFAPQLESEFRHFHRDESLTAIRRNLWIAAVFVLGFSLMTHMVMEPNVSRLLDTIRFTVFAPLLLLGLLIAHSRLYHRAFPIVSLIAAPIFGVGVAVLAIIAAAHGVNLIASVVLVTMYIYFMLGMLFYRALGVGLVIFIAYLVLAPIFGLDSAVILVDSGVLILTNLMGATVCYTLERANRTNFLEERLLTEMASRDGLTGINNRRVFDEHLERVWSQALRERTPLALMLIDIDHFKAYNDRYGHQVGDECLRRVAWCLMRGARRPLDVTARYGGEEFAIVLYDAHRDHIEEVARRVQAAIEELAIEHLDSPLPGKRITVSIGAACIQPVEGRSRYGFIQLADEALYAAKEQGRNSIVIHDKEYGQLSTGAFRHQAAV